MAPTITMRCLHILFSNGQMCLEIFMQIADMGNGLREKFSYTVIPWRPCCSSDQATSGQPGILRRWSYGVERLAARHSNCFLFNYFQESTQDSIVYPVLLFNVIRVSYAVRRHCSANAITPIPSVCLSHAWIVYQNGWSGSIIEILSPSDRPIIHQGLLRKSDDFTPNGGAEYKG